MTSTTGVSKINAHVHIGDGVGVVVGVTLGVTLGVGEGQAFSH